MKKRISVILAVLFAFVGMGAVGASPAAAHLGDWQTQYNKTYYDAGSVGYAAETNGNDYRGLAYVTSGPYGEHSRQFNYHLYFINARGQQIMCRLIERIDHGYYIFTRTTEACWVGWF